MFRQVGTGEILLILAVLMLLFGAKRLPELARSIGRSARELRRGMHEDDEEGAGGEHFTRTGTGTPGPNGEARPRS